MLYFRRLSASPPPCRGQGNTCGLQVAWHCTTEGLLIIIGLAFTQEAGQLRETFAAQNDSTLRALVRFLGGGLSSRPPGHLALSLGVGGLSSRPGPP